MKLDVDLLVVVELMSRAAHDKGFILNAFTDHILVLVQLQHSKVEVRTCWRTADSRGQAGHVSPEEHNLILKMPSNIPLLVQQCVLDVDFVAELIAPQSATVADVE